MAVMVPNIFKMKCAKEFAIAFTFAVTETMDNQREWIAKNGKDSIFALLREIYPEVRIQESL